MAEGLIEFREVSLGYGRRTVLSGMSFTIARGDFIGIVGPNGAGKTTLLRAVLGVLAPQSGEVVVHAPPEGLRFGYVPQRQEVDESFPLTALEVVAMGRFGLLGPWRKPGRADREQALVCLEHVGLAHLAEQRYRELSGGQKQRVLIARALAGEPSVLVLDEPTNDMDLTSERAVIELICHLHGAHGMTTLVASHLLNVVASCARKVAFVDDMDFAIRPVEEALTAENLSRLYGVPVQVAELGGRRVVV